jgi:hypothetical protein
MLIHPFVPSAQATSPRDPAKSVQTVPLPNGNTLPTASISAESSEEIFLRWTGFFTKLGPQIRLSPVPIFGVNSRTTKIKLSAEGFASAHQVHHQRRTVFEEEADQSVEKDCQFGCLNFSYKSDVVSPVTTYRNKWSLDWQQHWFYYTVSPLLPEGLTPWPRRSCHPFMNLT